MASRSGSQQSIAKEEANELHRKESNVDTGVGERTVDTAFFGLQADTETDPRTGFTGKEKKMIWDSWKVMKNGQDDFAIQFFLWLLDNVPGMRIRFDKFDANQNDRDALIADEMFVAHAQVVVGELHTIITLLPEPEDAMAKITHLAESHVDKRPRIGEEYFKPLHEKVHEFVSKTLEVPSDEEVVQLWTKLFGLLLDAVKAAEVKAGPVKAASGKDLEKKASGEGKGGCCCTIM